MNPTELSHSRVIIADDDSLIRMDLRGMLEDCGHTVIGEADNGDAAVHMTRNLRPDLVILDIMMGKVSGLVAAAVINRERLAPVLILTGYADEHMIREARDAGVLAYMVKPFRKEDLIPAIEIAVARYRELEALEGALDTLHEQAEARKAVAKARKLLMIQYEITEQEATRRIQAQSLSSKKTAREVAEAIILAFQFAEPIKKK